MKKNGFTLTELLAAIVIMAILVGIAIPVYFNISNNAKENEYDSKKSYYASLAARYAEENNLSSTTKISLSRLVSSGYTSAETYVNVGEDEIPFISNPLDSEDNLACRVIDITIDNYEYSAVVSEESDCSFAVSDLFDSRIGIKAYEFTNNKIGNQITIDSDATFNWTNKDVLIVVNPEYGNIYNLSIGVSGNMRSVDLDNMLTNITKNQTINVNDYSNVELISAEAITKQSFSAALEVESGIKSSTVEVRIDKEAPTVESSKFSGWTSTAKGATVYLSDGSGSGAKGVYVSEEDDVTKIDSTLIAVDENDAVSIEKVNGKELDNKRYYLWAVDNVGNVSKKSTYIDISNIDDDKPVTTGMTITSAKSGYNSIYVNVTITGTDGTGSGIVEACISTSANSSSCKWYTYGNNKFVFNNYQLSASEGSGSTITLYAYVKDAVGNVSASAYPSNSYKLYTKCSQTTNGAWSSCSKSCGSGTQSRTIYDKYLGNACSTSSKSCNTQDCCSSVTYQQTTTCSAVCGGGKYKRYAYSSYDGSRCSSKDDFGGSSCNTQSCCASTYPSYGGWGGCSASCGGGTQSRTVTYYSSYNNQVCSSSTQSQSCNTAACPTWKEVDYCDHDGGHVSWTYGLSSTKSAFYSNCVDYSDGSYTSIWRSYMTNGNFSCSDKNAVYSSSSDDTIIYKCSINKQFTSGGYSYKFTGSYEIVLDTTVAGDKTTKVKDRYFTTSESIKLYKYY